MDTSIPPHTDSSAQWLPRIIGLSFFASLLQNQYLLDSAKLLVLGTIVETGRRLFQWLMDRFKFPFCISARFNEGDPAYEWIVLFLTQENIWRRSREFHINAKNSKRKWAIDPVPGLNGNVDYVPTYELPQLFRWKGYWIEVKRSSFGQQASPGTQGGETAGVIHLNIYTFDMSVLSKLLEEARERYKETSRPNVTVYMADSPNYGQAFVWGNVKQKARRPLSSLILPEGVFESLIEDAQEFISTEAWYIEAGIPHRRGYLLHGPPGTGKTSTIYALAGELGLEIYTLSLSSTFVDDLFLQRVASSIPKNSIFLIEDIDCAFPPRDDDEDDPSSHEYGMISPSHFNRPAKSAITLSGLLNVLDGVGSEEGKLFFATTNYVDRLDNALLRPGRIDKKIEYRTATKAQASALFMHFFARADSSDVDKVSLESSPSLSYLTNLASQFASRIPEHTFSTAELQGFLLLCKKRPEQAIARVSEWVEQLLLERKEKEDRESERKMKMREKKDGMEARRIAAMLGGAAPPAFALAGASALSPGVPTPPSTPVTPSPAHRDDANLEKEADERLLSTEVYLESPTC